MTPRARVASAITLCLAAAVLCSGIASAAGVPAGRVIEGATMRSVVLGQDVSYTMYLPPDYDSSRRTYPIFYLLHGGGDFDNGWVHLGEINHIMDKGIAEGRITPMIIAMPNGQRNEKKFPLTYYMNDADGGFRWADMFLTEFMPNIEKEYRVRKGMGNRAIGGLSMGGYGGLMFAFQNPDMFSGVVAMSAGIYTAEQIREFSQPDFDRRYGPGFGATGKEGDERINDHFRANHPLGLMHRVTLEDLRKQRIFLDCGAEDRFDAGNFELHHFLKKSGVPHTFTIRTGEHDWTYWRSSVDKGLEFLTAIFHH